MTDDRFVLFSQAVERLREALAEPETDIVRDAAIQRFEFCAELGWKAIQSALRAVGLDCRAPRTCLKAAFQQGWITNELAWVALWEDRNRTSHTYNLSVAQAVYSRLTDHLRLFEALILALRKPASEG